MIQNKTDTDQKLVVKNMISMIFFEDWTIFYIFTISKKNVAYHKKHKRNYFSALFVATPKKKHAC
jgi:hypothetical protein